MNKNIFIKGTIKRFIILATYYLAAPAICCTAIYISVFLIYDKQADIQLNYEDPKHVFLTFQHNIAYWLTYRNKYDLTNVKDVGNFQMKLFAPIIIGSIIELLFFILVVKVILKRKKTII